MRAFYINRESDRQRRLLMEATCAELGLDCERVEPPDLCDEAVTRCVRRSEDWVRPLLTTTIQLEEGDLAGRAR